MNFTPDWILNDPDIKSFFAACARIEDSGEGGAELLNRLLSEDALEAYFACRELDSDIFSTPETGLDPDPANWSDDDMDAVVERVRRGERISL